MADDLVDLGTAIVMAGGFSKVGRELGVTKQRIWSWAKNRVPAEKVMLLEAAIGVPRSHIRPDIYPPERERPHISLCSTSKF